MKTLEKIQKIFSHVFARVSIVFELILLLRAALIYFHANPEALIISKFYALTDVVVRPFMGIFPSFSWQIGTIDTPTVSAMIGYALLLFLIYLAILLLLTIIQKIISND